MSLARFPQFATSLTALLSVSALPLPEVSRLFTETAWPLAAGAGAVACGEVVPGGVDATGEDAGPLAAAGDVAGADDEDAPSFSRLGWWPWPMRTTAMTAAAATAASPASTPAIIPPRRRRGGCCGGCWGQPVPAGGIGPTPLGCAY